MNSDQGALDHSQEVEAYQKEQLVKNLVGSAQS